MVIAKTAIVMSVLALGCVMSIEPVVPETEAFFEPMLLGTWESDPDSSGVPQRVVISRVDEDSLNPYNPNYYLIEYKDADGRSARFEGRLGCLGNHLVLEVQPASEGPNALLLRGRLAFAVEIGPDAISAAVLRADSVRAGLSDKRFFFNGYLSGSYLDPGESTGMRKGAKHLLLTGTTPEVRGMVLFSLISPGWLTERLIWRRVER